MLASVAGLAAIIVSDVAEAHAVSPLQDADDVSGAAPVLIQKVTVRSLKTIHESLAEALERDEVAPEEDDIYEDELPPVKKPSKKSKKRISFGRFEGY